MHIATILTLLLAGSKERTLGTHTWIVKQLYTIICLKNVDAKVIQMINGEALLLTAR